MDLSLPSVCSSTDPFQAKPRHRPMNPAEILEAVIPPTRPAGSGPPEIPEELRARLEMVDPSERDAARQKLQEELEYNESVRFARGFHENLMNLFLGTAPDLAVQLAELEPPPFAQHNLPNSRPQHAPNPRPPRPSTSNATQNQRPARVATQDQPPTGNAAQNQRRRTTGDSFPNSRTYWLTPDFGY